MEMTVAELALISGSELIGQANNIISGVATLQNADKSQISFLANSKYRKYLAATGAGAVVLTAADQDGFSGCKLISENPYLSIAKISAALHPPMAPDKAVHPSAVVHPGAVLGSGVTVGALCYVGDKVVLGDGVVLGQGSVLEMGCEIGANTLIGANVTISRQVKIGGNCQIHPGAVIGSDGFGLAQDGDNWVKFPQLGSVSIGDNVEIGSNTTIDRGTLEDTVIGRGAKLDNQIQVAHNVIIGEDTAIAACVGISGSTEIGARCTIAGGVGFVGHLTIADDVHITGMSMVTKSIHVAGVYSGIPSEKNRSWRKNIARFQQLDELARRLHKMEKKHG